MFHVKQRKANCKSFTGREGRFEGGRAIRRETAREPLTPPRAASVRTRMARLTRVPQEGQKDGRFEGKRASETSRAGSTGSIRAQRCARRRRAGGVLPLGEAASSHRKIRRTEGLRAGRAIARERADQPPAAASPESLVLCLLILLGKDLNRPAPGCAGPDGGGETLREFHRKSLRAGAPPP